MTRRRANPVRGMAELNVAASNSRLVVYWLGGWTPRLNPAGHAAPPVAVGIGLVIDPFGAGLAAFAGLLVVAALVFSLHYFDSVGTLYHVLMLTFLAAMCGFSLTGDLFNLFVWFELMSAAAFALCGYKTEEPGRSRARSTSPSPTRSARCWC